MAIARYRVDDLDAAVPFYTQRRGFRMGRVLGQVAVDPLANPIELFRPT